MEVRLICNRATKCTAKTECIHGVEHTHSVACQMSCPNFPDFRECSEVVDSLPSVLKDYLNQPMRFRAYDYSKGSFLYWEGVEETPQVLLDNPQRFITMLYSAEADCHGNYICEGDYITGVQYANDSNVTIQLTGKYPVVRTGDGFYLIIEDNHKPLKDISVINSEICGTFFDSLAKV